MNDQERRFSGLLLEGQGVDTPGYQRNALVHFPVRERKLLSGPDSRHLRKRFTGAYSGCVQTPHSFGSLYLTRCVYTY